MSLDRAAIEQALYTWVATATGLSAGAIWWGDQNVAQSRTFPFATLAIGGEYPAGPPELVETEPEDPGEGEEVELRYIQQLALTFSLQVWTAGSTGGNNARALAAAAQRALALPSVRAGLSAAGLSVEDFGEVETLPTLLGTDRVGRANLDVRFLTAESVSEHTGYIQTVMGNGVLDDTLTPYSVTLADPP